MTTTVTSRSAVRYGIIISGLRVARFCRSAGS
jgi:hypothetical protein